MQIRQALLETSRILGMIRERYPDYHSNPDALALAIEGHFRGVPDLVSIDGFDFLRVREETSTMLHVVGMAYFLPHSLVPFEARFRPHRTGVAFQVLRGLEDDDWNRMTRKKRWAAAYLYATDGIPQKWNWSALFEGGLDL